MVVILTPIVLMVVGIPGFYYLLLSNLERFRHRERLDRTSSTEASDRSWARCLQLDLRLSLGENHQESYILRMGLEYLDTYILAINLW